MVKFSRRPDSNREPAREHPLCVACAHFFVTWNRDLPYGCRALGFRSKRHPALVVYDASGLRCQAYERKRPRGK